MNRVLLILEVSRKQDYIFEKKKLRENAARSEVISFVTGSEFFEQTAGEFYDKKNNLVYSGGGHTVLQFNNREQAKSFAAAVTKAAMKKYTGLEMFAKLMDYDSSKSPAENLIELSAQLERKKSLRADSFRRESFGVEAMGEMSHRPEALEREELSVKDIIQPPKGWCFPRSFEDIAGEDNFIAVVHADGNAMGNRVNGIYNSGSDSWDTCCGRLSRFSEGIQSDFETAFSQMLEELIKIKADLEAPTLPLRPIILAGDDVCFVTRGKLGLECTRIFLEKLSKLKNAEDGQAYSACAGVAIVHTKYPFHKAYDLSEELCSSAKKFASALDSSRRISAMDWHIEYGQLKDGLAELREDYETEDGKRLELRPVTVVVPEDIAMTEEMAYRSWNFFRSMCSAMQGQYGKISRGKIKELRTAMKQGETETEFFMRDREIGDLLYNVFASRYTGQDERWAQYAEMLFENTKRENKAFISLDEERCLFFDSIEIIDQCEFLKGAEE